jgi:uncharacterized protein (DUF2235 family)
MKRIVLCFDGTWNTPDDNGDEDGDSSTNVCRLHEAVLPQGSDGRVQKSWYDKGVGTDWYNRLAGGIAGVGLSRNIRQGYGHLAEHYEAGDEIFVFGFSRGAYTARSLVGMIRNCGLLRQPDPELVHEAYQIYRTRNDGVDSAQARAFRAHFAWPGHPEIQCLGVWDTVGALGIPLQSFGFFNRSFYEFHDVQLSSIVRNAFQALAIDEHRQEYVGTLWSPSARPEQRVEQKWFPGAHANIGGGYDDDPLADVALAWMMDRAGSCGLALDPARRPVLTDAHWTTDLKDSFAEFLKGFYQYFNARHYRSIGTTPFGCEWLDGSAVMRFRGKDYRPENRLGEHLGCDEATPETLRELVGSKIWHLLEKLR